MADLIRIEDLCIERDGHSDLAGVSLTLQGKEQLAILGADGAGKTTLLRAIVGLETIASGRITLLAGPAGKSANSAPTASGSAFCFRTATTSFSAYHGRGCGVWLAQCRLRPDRGRIAGTRGADPFWTFLFGRSHDPSAVWW